MKPIADTHLSVRPIADTHLSGPIADEPAERYEPVTWTVENGVTQALPLETVSTNDYAGSGVTVTGDSITHTSSAVGLFPYSPQADATESVQDEPAGFDAGQLLDGGTVVEDHIPRFEIQFYPDVDPLTAEGLPSQVFSETLAMNDGGFARRRPIANGHPACLGRSPAGTRATSQSRSQRAAKATMKAVTMPSWPAARSVRHRAGWHRPRRTPVRRPARSRSLRRTRPSPPQACPTTSANDGVGGDSSQGSPLEASSKAISNGIYNVGVGVGKFAWDVFAVPIDLAFGTEYSYYGSATAGALRQGVSVPAITGEVAANLGTLGLKGLKDSAQNYYETGDPTQIQEYSGTFLAGAVARASGAERGGFGTSAENG